MKIIKSPLFGIRYSSQLFINILFLSFIAFQASCAHVEQPANQGFQQTKVGVDPSMPALVKDDASKSTKQVAFGEPGKLPVKYQSPSYLLPSPQVTGGEGIASDEFAMPVGADITSTTGPIALRDILKRLAILKNMNISWASDVDQYALVDVDIRAEDDFFESIDNILRQLDYFHEVKVNTIVVRYKETRKFHVAMPFMSSKYSIGVGGNVLGGSGGSNVVGNLKIDSGDNTFDIWDNIKTNIDQILDIWEESPVPAGSPPPVPSAAATSTTTTPKPAPLVAKPRRSSTGKGYYSIDRPIGLITVTAPRPLVEKIAIYLENLKSELYRQIAIEAKIIEVKLDDQSKTGIDWSDLLSDKHFSFTATFGQLSAQQPFGNARSLVLNPVPFDLIVSAIATQGETTVLANPKLSVMNGQPAMISIGENSTYIDSVTTTIEEGVATTSVTTSSVLSGLGMGVIATIMENDEIILSLTPVTSSLSGDTIEYRSFGSNIVGLPVVQLKEMNTTVRVKDGQLLVVGGLIDKVNDEQNTKVPILGSIPIINKLFSSESKRKSRSELIILLRPKIIS